MVRDTKPGIIPQKPGISPSFSLFFRRKFQETNINNWGHDLFKYGLQDVGILKNPVFPRSSGSINPDGPSLTERRPVLSLISEIFSDGHRRGLPLIPRRSVLSSITLCLHSEFRYGNSGSYSGKQGDLQKILRGMSDIQAQHACTIPARHTLLRTRDIVGPVKSKNGRVLLSRMQALYQARARHRVLLRQAVKRFFPVRFMPLLPNPFRSHRLRRARYCI